MEVISESLDDCLRVVIISDTHTFQTDDEMKPMPIGDVLIHAGDFSQDGHKTQLIQFINWFDSHPHKYKLFIAGNHDVTLHTEYYVNRGAMRFQPVMSKKIGPLDYAKQCKEVIDGSESIYLQDSSYSVSSSTIASGNSIKFYGSPWQPYFDDWAFNAARGQSLSGIWAKIPPDVDVLVTHGPPRGILDRNGTGKEVGCADLLVELQSRTSPPRLHAFGHVHDSYGESLLAAM